MLRSFTILSLVFILFQVFPLQATENSFFSQVRKLTDQATRKREGLVIWTDLSHSKQDFFGNSKWVDQKFLSGSLFKLLIAQAALENNIHFQYSCTGSDAWGGKKYSCWTYKGHGQLDLPKALAISCNLYFQNLGMKLGLDKIVSVMKQYPSLPSLAFSKIDLARFSIGDDPSYRVTPRQMSTFWNQYVKTIQEPHYDAIFQGLRRSVQAGGTASKLKESPLEILAKTGTGDSLNSNYKTNAWFLAAYPAKNPQYTLLILLQEAHGFEEATRLAEKIFSEL